MKDPTRGQWVLIRPKGEAPGDGPCRFCPGAESLAGNEIAAYRKEGSPANSPDWSVRVVPEPDAYFRIEWELVREGVGMFDMITPRGASELIIESPRHDDTLATMPREQVEAVLWMYRDRLLDLKRDNQIRDIMISRRHHKPGRGGPPSVLARHRHPHRVRRDAARAARGPRVLPVQASLPLLRHPAPGDRRRVTHRPPDPAVRRARALRRPRAARAVDPAAPARLLLRGLAQHGVRTRPGKPAVRHLRARWAAPSTTPATSWPCTPPPTCAPESSRATGPQSATTTTGTSRS